MVKRTRSPRRLSPAYLFILTLTIASAAPAHFQTSAGIALNVTADGSFSIASREPAWTFGGSTGVSLSAITSSTGTDAAGTYRKISFPYAQNGVPTVGSVRVYEKRPVVIFSTTLLAAAPNSPLFPRIRAYPQGLYEFGFKFTYLYQYGPSGQGPDSPWAYFDASGNTFIVSPASHFPLAWTTQDQTRAIVAGIRPDIPTLPAGFTQETMLVIGVGINHTWDLWGHALTDLQGRTRTSVESDISLAALSYWTDSVEPVLLQLRAGHGL